MAAEPRAAAPKSVQAVVARGHTIAIGKDAVAYGPGEVIDLAPEEAQRLTALGFLIVPGAPPLPLGNGPAYGEETPVSITTQAESR